MQCDMHTHSNKTQPMTAQEQYFFLWLRRWRSVHPQALTMAALTRLTVAAAPTDEMRHSSAQELQEHTLAMLGIWDLLRAIETHVRTPLP